MNLHLSSGSGGSRLLPILQPWLWLWMGAALIAIFQTGPMPTYSTRALGVAWEMWNSGQFLVPINNGVPYSHKVPLLFWLIHAGWAVGGVGDVWPRLLEVLIGAGVLLLAQRLARVLFPREPQVARLTPWLLAAFSYAFLFGLQIMYETLLALCVLAALNALVGRDVGQRPWFAGFALAVAAGLMSKGPVMLLHVAFPFLLGPLWHPWARKLPGQWYGRGGLALLGACAILLCWVIPAALAGGEAYRQELLFMQTAGRVVESFDHAQPWWWYASVTPLLLLPWLLWPRAWQALARVVTGRGGVGAGMLGCWLLPTGIAFSLVSGKQVYYLLPELAGVAMLLAAGLGDSERRRARSWWWSGNWLLALVAFGLSVALLLAPGWVADGRIQASDFIEFTRASPWFAVAAALLGFALLWPMRNLAQVVRQVSTVSIIGACIAYMMFAQTLWQRFDLTPAAVQVSAFQRHGIAVAHFRLYENQFQFLGRLQQPLLVLDDATVSEWARRHVQGRLVYTTRNLDPADLAHADLVQPYRGEWLLIERADVWVQRRHGGSPLPPAHPARRYPPDYWRYAAIDAAPAQG